MRHARSLGRIGPRNTLKGPALPSGAHAAVGRRPFVTSEAVGLLSGFAHPISGLDHITAMLAVGLSADGWVARRSGCCG